MSAQKDILHPPHPGPRREEDEPRTLPLNSRAGTMPEEDTQRLSCPEAADREADVIRLVMGAVDAEISSWDDRVETQMAAKERFKMLAAGVRAAQAELRRNPHAPLSALGPIIVKAVHIPGIESEERRELDEVIRREQKPRRKSGIVEAAEEVQAKADQPCPLIEDFTPADYQHLPPETVMKMQGPDGKIVVMTLGALLTAYAVRSSLQEARPGTLDLSQVTWENTNLRALESSLFDEKKQGKRHFQHLVDDEKAKREEQKQQARDAAAAANKTDREGWTGEVDKKREIEQALETENQV